MEGRRVLNIHVLCAECSMCLKIVIFCHAYVIMKGEGGGKESEREREMLLCINRQA